MNKLIILAAITMVSYGEVQHCSRTYNLSSLPAVQTQYNNHINCSNNNNCSKAIVQFADAASTTTDKLVTIINTFKLNHDVSYNKMYMWILYFTLDLSFHRNQNTYKAVIS